MKTHRHRKLANASWIVFLAFCAAVAAADPNGGAFTHRNSLILGEMERTYTVRIPKNLASDARVPLVLVFHGSGGDPAGIERISGFTKKAISAGFIVVYPEGTRRGKTDPLTWNAEHCCGFAKNKNIDDVGFVRALIAKLVSTYPIAPNMIFATGMSNGAMLTHRIGIELANTVAAIAPVMGTLFGDEKVPVGSVSAIMLNGVRDETLPFGGGPLDARFKAVWDGTPAQPALRQGQFWATANRCAQDAEQNRFKTFSRWRYRCPHSVAVELYLLGDSDHAWPAGAFDIATYEEPSTHFNATDVIWNFFSAHPK